VEVCLAVLKRVFGMDGTLAKTLVGLATRVAAKVAAYTYGHSTSTGFWVVLKAASRTFGPEILATLI
jgi:hypothetical protein